MFTAYIAFSILALLNVITATFVQHAIERTATMHQLKQVAYARTFFAHVDSDCSGTITWQELTSALGDPETIDFFSSIDVDISEAKCLFEMLDRNGTGEIDFLDFMSGCLGLQGPAKSIDLVLAVRELKATLARLENSLHVGELGFEKSVDT